MEDAAIYRDLHQFETVARLAKAEQENAGSWLGRHSAIFIEQFSPTAVLRLLAVVRADMEDAQRYREMVMRAQEIQREAESTDG